MTCAALTPVPGHVCTIIGFPVGDGVDVVSLDTVDTNFILPSVSGKTSRLAVRYPLRTSASSETGEMKRFLFKTKTDHHHKNIIYNSTC